MIFKAVIPWREKYTKDLYASRIQEAAIQLAVHVFGEGWGSIKVFESPDGKSAIVLSPGKRPFKVEESVKSRNNER
jgi:hypothetical protein